MDKILVSWGQKKDGAFEMMNEPTKLVVPSWDYKKLNLMKKTLHIAFLFFALLGFGITKAQPCTVDPSYTAPGIYPSDTLQDMFVGTATLQTIQFVFPVDTVLFGFTLPFDSFVVSSVSNIPPGVLWECNQNHPTCSYVSNPPNLTRGCVKVYGTPTSPSAGYPAYDSLIVTGVAYVTLFSQVQSLSQDISVYYRVTNSASNSSPFANTLDLQVAPNPIATNANVSFNLVSSATAVVSVYNMLGEEVIRMDQGMMSAGQKSVSINTNDLESGMYFLRVSINDGEYVETQKIATQR